MKLIPEWKRAYKLFSVQIFGLITAVGVAWPMMPDDLKAYFPEDIMPYVSAIAFIGILTRVVKQGKE